MSWPCERRSCGAWRRWITIAAAALAAPLTAALAAQVSQAAEPAPTAATAFPRPARPYWIELTAAQRDALAPLASDWERLDLQTKKKWVEIGNRYPRMTPDEQGRTQQRMREWALLSPDQRRVARDSFARVRAMNPEQRADLLKKYQNLPPEKRQALTTEGKASKVIVVPKPGAAPAPSARRVEIREGAQARTPAQAAQKGGNPLVAPAVPAASPPAAVAVPVVQPAAP